MMQTRIARVSALLVLFTAVSMSCERRARETSDDYIVADLNQQSTQPDFWFTEGKVRFVAPVWGQAKATLNNPGDDDISELPLYRALAKEGLLTISDEHNVGDEHFEYVSDMASAMMQGVKLIATVAPTPNGLRTARIDSTKDRRRIGWKLERASIDALTANDSVRSASGRYRLVTGTAHVNMSPELYDAWVRARGGEKFGRERQFRALLRFDPVERHWSIQASDVGAKGAPFAMHNVRACVEKIEATGHC